MILILYKYNINIQYFMIFISCLYSIFIIFISYLHDFYIIFISYSWHILSYSYRIYHMISYHIISYQIGGNREEIGRKSGWNRNEIGKIGKKSKWQGQGLRDVKTSLTLRRLWPYDVFDLTTSLSLRYPWA